MQVVILAGGLGTRISEESYLVPKPMIRIGELPILWHIMQYFSSFGFDDFIICAGYKQHVIKEFFNHLSLYTSNVTFEYGKDTNIHFHGDIKSWKVTVVDTGIDTMTGGRLKQIKPYLKGDTFFMTYGDGLSNIDLHELIKHHQTYQKLLTISVVQPFERFGRLEIDEQYTVKSFREKVKEDAGWINGGFMVMHKQVLDYIEGNHTIFEHEPIQNLVNVHQVSAYKHRGFWQCMDTMRDKEYLERLWMSKEAPWKVW